MAMAALQDGRCRRLLEAYHNLLPFPELRPLRKKTKLGGPAQWLRVLGLGVSCGTAGEPAAGAEGLGAQGR